MKVAPDTRYFHFYNANPKNRRTDDCVIRAICTALEKPYLETYKEMFEMSCKTGYMVNSQMLIEKYLSSKGWIKRKQPKKWDNTKYTGKEFCSGMQQGTKPYFPSKYKNLIANIGGHHIVAIVDGVVNDIWDSTNGCIGNYWEKV